ncbi:MAG: MATE family efflux transporter [Gammaproteobacteria bacterium]|nr:MAG: MATE family efflux transporter [Gammaproteobacteria bacterium]
MSSESFVIKEGTPKGVLIKKVLTLSVPIILSNLLYTVQNFVSLLLVAPLGSLAIAGVGFASTLLWLVYSAMATVYTGVNVLVAQSVGANKRAGIYTSLGVILSVLFALPLTLWGEELIKFFLSLFGTPKEVLETAVEYLKPIFLLLPFAFVTNSLNAVFNGLGKTKVVFYATIFTTAVNIFLALVLIYGKLGFPALGVEGAGLAVALAETLAIGVYLPFLLKDERITPRSGEFFNLKELLKLLKVGLPTGIERLIMSFSYNIFVGLVAICGTNALAGFQIGLRIESVSFTIGMAFAFAGTTLAGQNLGAKNPYGIKVGVKTTLAVALILMTSLGILMALFSHPLARFFTNDPEVVSYTVKYLYIVAFSQPLMAVIFVLSGAIRGLGKTKIPLMVNIANFWLVRLIPSMVLLKVFKTPLVPWGAMITENLTRSLSYLYIYKKVLKF